MHRSVDHTKYGDGIRPGEIGKDPRYSGNYQLPGILHTAGTLHTGVVGKVHRYLLNLVQDIADGLRFFQRL